MSIYFYSFYFHYKTHAPVSIIGDGKSLSRHQRTCLGFRVILTSHGGVGIDEKSLFSSIQNEFGDLVCEFQ